MPAFFPKLAGHDGLLLTRYRSLGKMKASLTIPSASIACRLTGRCDAIKPATAAPPKVTFYRRSDESITGLRNYCNLQDHL